MGADLTPSLAADATASGSRSGSAHLIRITWYSVTRSGLTGKERPVHNLPLTGQHHAGHIESREITAAQVVHMVADLALLGGIGIDKPNLAPPSVRRAGHTTLGDCAERHGLKPAQTGGNFLRAHAHIPRAARRSLLIRQRTANSDTRAPEPISNTDTPFDNPPDSRGPHARPDGRMKNTDTLPPASQPSPTHEHEPGESACFGSSDDPAAVILCYRLTTLDSRSRLTGLHRRFPSQPSTRGRP